ncbi:MAG: hypothetical protein H6573_22550 [Lewinellaceae bacterium]|nr:hypothetical protein [Lewinellaceae bacterium]
MFDRFYQAPGYSSPSGKPGGAGIGLALTKELLYLMGGGIEVQSEVGKGTCFTFRLPVRHEAKIEATDRILQPAAPAAATQLPVAGQPEGWNSGGRAHRPGRRRQPGRHLLSARVPGGTGTGCWKPAMGRKASTRP